MMMHVFASTFAVKTTQNGTLGYSDEINEQAEVFLFDEIYGLIWIHNALHCIALNKRDFSTRCETKAL